MIWFHAISIEWKCYFSNFRCLCYLISLCVIFSPSLFKSIIPYSFFIFLSFPEITLSLRTDNVPFLTEDRQIHSMQRAVRLRSAWTFWLAVFVQDVFVHCLSVVYPLCVFLVMFWRLCQQRDIGDVNTNIQRTQLCSLLTNLQLDTMTQFDESHTVSDKHLWVSVTVKM